MENILTMENHKTSPFIEKEVEMGFFENYFKQDKDVQFTIQGGCQRISQCSCNCNDCLVLSG